MAGQPSSKGRAGPGTCAAHWAWVQRTSPSMHDQCPARCSQLPLPVWRGLEASIWPRRFGKRGFLSYSPGLVARAGSIARAALALQWQCMKQNVIVYYKYNYAQGALSHSMPRMWSGRCLAVGREKPAGRRFWVMSKMRPAQHPPPPPPTLADTPVLDDAFRQASPISLLRSAHSTDHRIRAVDRKFGSFECGVGCFRTSGFRRPSPLPAGACGRLWGGAMGATQRQRLTDLRV